MAKQAVDESMVALNHLSSDEPLQRVYFFYGEDTFMIDKLIDGVQAKRFKGKSVDPLCWEVYRADETPVSRVLESVRTISMFGGVKVVVYRDIEKLSESDVSQILTYAENPARAHLVLVAVKIDSRKKSWIDLKKKTFSVQCAPLSERNVNEYIRTAGKNLQFAQGAIDAIANCTGPNRAMIERAIEKLELAVGKAPITPELVEAHVIDTRERSVFELTKSLTHRDIPAALEALRVLIDQKQEPIVINGMIARHARMMLQVKLGQSQRIPDAEIAQKIGINAYAMREYLEAVRHYSLSELYMFHADVYEADKSMKSMPIPSSLVLEQLLLSLCKPQTSS